MADLFADVLMLWIKTVMVAAFLHGLVFFVSGVIAAVVERAHDKARTKKKKEVDSDDV